MSGTPAPIADELFNRLANTHSCAGRPLRWPRMTATTATYMGLRT